MSATETLDFGIFPPGETVEIDGAKFVRDDYRTRLGRIAVWDMDVNDEAPIGYLPAGFTTKDAALAWLNGFQAGHRAGEAQGRRDLQRDLRALLDVQ